MNIIPLRILFVLIIFVTTVHINGLGMTFQKEDLVVTAH